MLIEQVPHKEYTSVKVHSRKYWIYEMLLDFKSYGIQRVIVSKEGQYEKPIFLVTNAMNFSAKFIVSLYLRRFSIEIFFKDAKQYLHLESFFCRSEEKWNLHLLLTNIFHWCIQRKNSISKAVRSVREDINRCLLFINGNSLLAKFFDELRNLCQT